MSYSEKEIAIFNGLIDLIRKGSNLYTIKVSDIAKAANIGKGTLYDYFSSKEEAISQALLYFINMEIESACNRIESKENFMDKFYELLLVIADSLENNISTINILLATGGIRELYEHLIDEKYSINKFSDRINNVMADLLETGYNEGVISGEKDKFYQMMAVRGSLSGFSHYLSHKNCYEDVDVRKAMETAYKLLLKTLN